MFIPVDPVLNELLLLLELVEHFFFERIKVHEISGIINFSGIQYFDFEPGPVINIDDGFADLADHLHAFYDLSEHHVLAVQMRTALQSDEKLTRVAVPSLIGHAEQSRTSVSSIEILVIKLLSIYAMSTLSVLISYVSSLNHESVDYTMNICILVMQFLSLCL